MKNWRLITKLLTVFVLLFTSQVSARFLAVDPVRVVDQNGEINQEILHNPQRLNLYTYGLNNPFRYVDRDGRSPEFALSPTEYFALRAEGIGADPYTWEGTNRTARYLQAEAGNQLTAMLTLYGGGGIFARSTGKNLVGNVDDFVASNYSGLRAKIGEKIKRGSLSFQRSRAGFDQAVGTVKQTLSNPSKTTGIIPKSKVRGDYNLIHVYSSKTNHTVSLRVLEKGKYQFDTLIKGKSSKF